MSQSQRWRAYVVCVLGWMFDFYDLMLFAYLAKAIAVEFEWGPHAPGIKGLLVGAALATSGLGGIVFGGLADRFGRRKVMVWTILLYSLGTGLCGFANGLYSLLLFRAITGFGVGGEWATGHALMAEIFPREQRGRAAAFLQAGEPVGVALAVLAGLWLEPRVGWRGVFWLSALPAGLVLLVRSQVPESPLWLQTRGTHSPQPSLPGEGGGFIDQYRILFRDHWRLAGQAWVLAASKLGTYWITYVWLPEYFAAADPGLRLKFILVAQGGQFLGMMLFGFVSDHFGRRPAYTAYSLLTAAGLFLMIEHPGQMWLAMGAVGLGSGCTAGFGALLAELFPTTIRNTAMGTVYNLGRAFQFVPQAAMGIIVAEAGVSRGLAMALVFALITASWVWTFPETRGKALD